MCAGFEEDFGPRFGAGLDTGFETGLDPGLDVCTAFGLDVKTELALEAVTTLLALAGNVARGRGFGFGGRSPVEAAGEAETVVDVVATGVVLGLEWVVLGLEEAAGSAETGLLVGLAVADADADADTGASAGADELLLTDLLVFDGFAFGGLPGGRRGVGEEDEESSNDVASTD